jgi:hypothetical protein
MARSANVLHFAVDVIERHRFAKKPASTTPTVTSAIHTNSLALSATQVRHTLLQLLVVNCIATPVVSTAPQLRDPAITRSPRHSKQLWHMLHPPRSRS